MPTRKDLLAEKKFEEEIESKPRGVQEPKLKDAIHTVEEYLRDKRRVLVYEWEERRKSGPSKSIDRVETEDDSEDEWEQYW